MALQITEGDRPLPLRTDSIERQVKVKGTASPDDPDRQAYWQHCQQRHGNQYWSRRSGNP